LWLRRNPARNERRTTISGRPTLFSLLAFTFLLFLLTGTAQGQGPVKFTHGTRVWPTYTYSYSETVAPLFPSIENVGFYPYTALDWESRTEKPVAVEYDSLVLENE
jgi:hypothetical protein